MREEKLIIIGCGYLGSAAGAALLCSPRHRKRFGEIIATTTTPARAEELERLGFTPAVLELAGESRLRELLAGCSAALLTVAAGRKSAGYREVYLEGIRHFLNAARGADLRRIIYTSSIAVYGQEDGSWVDESSPAEPATENGRILLDAERALLRGAEELGATATSLRPSGIYGPGRGPQNLIASLAGKERSDGGAWLNLVHRDDIVQALLKLLEIPYHGVLNLNDDQPATRREYYDRRLAAAGLAPIRWAALPEKPSLGKRVRNELIKKTLCLTLLHPTH